MEWIRQYCQWRHTDLREEDGVVVGSDLSQEWLLPWWWENLRKRNDYSVTFVDFGLSDEKKQWCRERGELISLPLFDFLVKDREEMNAALADQWEQRYGDHFWSYRKSWFKKPFACLRSPYRRTLWLDLDCGVLGPLKDLFHACENSSGIAMVKDRDAPTPYFPIFNSGVIAFQRNLNVMQEWAEQALEQNGSFRGDQDLLSMIIHARKIAVRELSDIYNWNIFCGSNPEALICHWIGDRGKQMLRDQIILQQFFEDTPL